MTLKNWLSTREAAEILGLSEQRVRVLAQKKQLPSTLKSRCYFFRRRDVEAFKLQERKVGRPPKTGDS